MHVLIYILYIYVLIYIFIYMLVCVYDCYIFTMYFFSGICAALAQSVCL